MKLLIALFFIMSATQSMAGTRYGEDGGCSETGGQGGIGTVTITCSSGSTTTVINGCSRSRGSWMCGSIIYNPDGSKKMVPKQEKTKQMTPE